MPIYEYLCPNCECRFESRRSFSEAEEEVSCPKCQTIARKLPSRFTAFSSGAGGYPRPISGMGISEVESKRSDST